MAVVTEKGIEPPTHLELEDQPNLLKWFLSLWSTYPRIRVYSVSVTPGSIAANTISDVAVTVTGLSTTDILNVNKPTLTAGIGIVGIRASAADQATITYINNTGSPVTPATETYQITAIRQ